jgi:hypothetical protein
MEVRDQARGEKRSAMQPVGALVTITTAVGLN